MKKIETKEERKKRNQRNQIIIGTIMILLLVISSAGFAILSRSEDSNNTSIIQKEINGITFTKQDSYWTSIINERSYAFFYLPSETENVSINITNTLLDYANKPLYIVHPSSNVLQQIQYNLHPDHILRINNACIKGEDCEDENWPIKSCENDNIIILKSSINDTQVYQIEKCIYIEGDLNRGIDKFLQKILGII